MLSPAESALPPPSPDASTHSQKLAEHIASTIVAEGEWISFSRYMELALYAPGLGYYAAGARKFGSEGDFVTSSEISPMFARCLALQAAQVLKDIGGGDVLELGPGSGIFAADLHEALKEMEALPRRYLLLEVSPDLRERQRALLAQRFPTEMDRFEWIDSLPGQIRGVVIANEGLDVVPCSLVHRNAGGDYFEQGVILTEAGFAFEDQPLQDAELKRRAQSAFPPGDYDYVSEVNFAAEALVRTIAASLEAGVALFIDYGFPEREYYHSQRASGTM